MKYKIIRHRMRNHNTFFTVKRSKFGIWFTVTLPLPGFPPPKMTFLSVEKARKWIDEQEETRRVNAQSKYNRQVVEKTVVIQLNF